MWVTQVSLPVSQGSFCPALGMTILCCISNSLGKRKQRFSSVMSFLCAPPPRTPYLLLRYSFIVSLTSVLDLLSPYSLIP